MVTTSKAHGRGPNCAVGTGEQAAAMYLIADLSRRDRWLRAAGVAFLDDLLELLAGTEHTRLLNAAKEARASIDSGSPKVTLSG